MKQNLTCTLRLEQGRPHNDTHTPNLFSPFVLQMFVDNFQTAKEALSAATAQAAEKAASSVRDFAQKSFRLSMDIKLKAPLIIIPQSSTSHNAVVVDLGLITVGNGFSLLPAEGFPLPAVVEKMDVKLTQLKLSRYHLDQRQCVVTSSLMANCPHSRAC